MTQEEMTKPFSITSVCREDLKAFFTHEQIEEFDDADMEYLARKLADASCDETAFWQDLEIIGEAVLAIR